ncbi:mitochondrial amidoxime-reducing component 1-like isoform X2 [Episyrphus balteatus]|nr:mitochondrial amidoxime-reducing component 1-like isoform X2 [Episyrphus balteatus]XP_055845846.1 mitochondrial amidoxime-reducing component 1-like isoform X2 [Episyrphus balteatus]XP_055845847.1 mitochondrial amidoxime-reducing component 1-like isoform X2 [Episyrphus balteatus]
MATIGIGLGVTVISGISYLYYRYTKKEVIPTKWKLVGKLDELFLYPVKSCGPIELDEAVCENLGVRKGDIKDRALMIIEESGQVVTARQYPHMFKISPKVVGRSKLIFSAPGMKDLHFDFAALGDDSNGDIEALIYGFTATVLDCGEIYHKWFSQFILDKPDGLKLVYYPYSIATRPIDRDYVEGIFKKQDTGTFHDQSSYHLMNETTVQELNARLKDKVPISQFRGNFNIRTIGEPYEEDYWDWIRIGDQAIFRNLGPCYRCILPNINPYTAERHTEAEPLKTLRKYRDVKGTRSKAPGLGIQLGLRAEGVVKKGDCIYVEDLP